MDTHEPLAVGIAEASRLSSVSRSSLYLAMQSGDLKFAKIGARRLVLVEDLRAWLQSLRQSIA